MSKKLSPVKKISKNPLAKDHPRAKQNRRLGATCVIALGVLAIFYAVSYFTSKLSDKPEEKIEKVVKKEKEPPKKKVVKPLSDEDFKGAKEYNFYTQLEERSLVLDGVEERFGGMALESIHEPPKIILESAGQVEAKVNVPKQVVTNVGAESLKIAPLVLESTTQSKPVAQQKTETNGAKNIRLQVGSFTADKDAQTQKAKLERYGFAARVVKGKNKAQQDVYRVHIGPFSKQEIKAVKERLNTLSISFFEVK